ncbi:hypothetical protein MTR67_041844 [Solanum verrucosum]|uniref:DUF4283 domain-containing protein n=1 Tax=Solanum verrucosum TaxID=315347 RepID=A0AAF0UM61_SOLVR|nr:hypothetical protein MTR67_041844 [Solanum verrucosum]
MIIKENLAYAVVGKFSYGWPNIQDLRKIIPKQCELKNECNIGLLSNRHVLIRASCLEDYVSLLSKPVFYLMHKGWSYPMRTWKWEPMFDPLEETSTAIAWISFPSLPPNFFVKEAVFSLAAAVGKPLQVDLATKNQTRPSCARVKVEVDLQREFPKRTNVGLRRQSGEVSEKWIKIKYDYVPTYCKSCKIQGHNEQQCYVIHPELYPKKDGEDGEKNKKEGEVQEGETGKKHMIMVQQSLRTQEQYKEQKITNGGMWRKEGRGKPEQIWNKKSTQQNVVSTDNKFEALADSEKKPAIDAALLEIETGQGTKHWVEKTFGEKKSTLGMNSGKKR